MAFDLIRSKIAALDVMSLLRMLSLSYGNMREGVGIEGHIQSPGLCKKRDWRSEKAQKVNFNYVPPLVYTEVRST